MQCPPNRGLEYIEFDTTSQSKGAMGELLTEGFRLLVLFKATMAFGGLSSSRTKSTLLIHSATGLKGWPHSEALISVGERDVQGRPGSLIPLGSHGAGALGRYPFHQQWTLTICPMWPAKVPT